MSQITLDQPHHVTAGFLGVPGNRTFVLQAEDEHVRIAVVAEKQQIAGIAELLSELLARVNDEPASDWDVDAMALREPVEPVWRVGTIQVGVDPDRATFLLELHELQAEADDEGEGEGEGEDAEADLLRITMSQDAAKRLAAHAAHVVGQGRPRCELCGRPKELDGSHVCPATNGHGRLTR